MERYASGREHRVGDCTHLWEIVRLVKRRQAFPYQWYSMGFELRGEVLNIVGGVHDERSPFVGVR